MPSSLFKPITMKPLVGIFDNRSNVDETPPGAFRWIENFGVNKDLKLARAKGFVRAYPGPCPRNHDFHDQHGTREPITSYFPSVANDGTRRLFAATKTRILLLNETTGDWGTIGSGFGADGQPSLTQLRFNAAELQNHIYFTNDFDRIQYHVLGSGTVQPIPVINGDDGAITKARRILSWNGVILIMNIVEGGVRFASRIRWSDLNDGLSWVIGGGSSISDFQDLDYGHTILNAVPIGNSLYVFCDRSIWRCNFTVDTGLGTAVLTCVRVYDEPRNHAKCLVYPNTLVSNGRSAFYLGADGWYEFNPGQMSEPERLEWAHRSTKIIFDGTRAIDTSACASPVSEYRPAEDTVYLSWGKYNPIATGGGSPVGAEIDCATYVATAAPAGTGLNDYTMAFNLKHRTAALLSYGSVALVNFSPDAAGVGGCNTVTKFLGTNGVDWTIKELNVGDSYEMFNPATGVYSVVGYYSILRFLFPFERMDSEKEVASFLAEIVADNPDDVAVAKLRLGTADRVVDPNEVNGKCGVLWRQLSSKPIKCGYAMTPEQYVAAGVRPNPPVVAWDYLLRGRFLFAELTLAAADGTAPTTGSCAISRFQVEARLL